MTESDFIEELSVGSGAPKPQIRLILAEAKRVLMTNLHRGTEVPVPSIGKFCLSPRAARTGRNPGTGETIQIPAKVLVKLKPHKDLREVPGG